jgi:TolB-like protein
MTETGESDRPSGLPGDDAAEHRASQSAAADQERAPHAPLVADVFVSYASHDAAVASAIVEALEREGLRCWIAPRDVVPGSLYADGIVRAINAAKVFALVLSEHAVASAHVGKEVERASSKRRPIIALRTDQAPLTPALEYFLSESQWIDLGPGKLDAGAIKLADAVRQYLAASPALNSITDSVGSGRSAADGLAARPPSGGASITSGRTGLMVVALAIISLALVWLLADKFGQSRRPVAEQPAVAAQPATPPSAAPAPAVSQNSVAVLPFIDLSEKKDQAYFSDGLAEELIDLLARIPDLKVTARTSSFSFRGRAVTVGEIGQTLQVAHVLEGSVRKAGHAVRITVQLERADNGYHLWSETYDRDLKDVFKAQDDIARAVVDKLKLTLLANVPVVPARTSNPEAHSLYLQGRYFVQTDTQAGLDKAVGYFKRAIEIDPGYASAWADLAFATFRQVANSYIPVRAGLDRTLTAARKASALDPTLADPYLVICEVRMAGEADWAGARAALDKAMQLDPNSVGALIDAGHLTRATGSNDEALVFFHKALQRDPLNLLTRRYVARVLYFAGRLDEAEATVRKVLDLSASFSGAHYELGRILLARGQVAAAVAEFEAEANPSWKLFGLPLGYHAQGRIAEANALLAQMLRNPAGAEFQVAETYAFFGDTDQAIAWLNRAVGNDTGILWVRGDPLLRGITSDPRYAALLRRLHLPP